MYYEDIYWKIDLKTREASSHLGTARSELDYEDPPFEGKMSEIKRIRKVDNQEIIKILEREVHVRKSVY